MTQIYQVIFTFKTGHTGVNGNEWVYRLAGSHVTEDDQTVDEIDIIITMKKTDQPDFCENFVIASLSRIKELVVKLLTSKHKRHKKDIIVVNKYWTGLWVIVCW